VHVDAAPETYLQATRDFNRLSGASSRKMRSDSDSQIASCPSKKPMTNPGFSGRSVLRAASQALRLVVTLGLAVERADIAVVYAKPITDICKL
jgi:hypothetical protein